MYRVEGVGLKNYNYALKITVFVRGKAETEFVYRYGIHGIYILQLVSFPVALTTLTRESFAVTKS